jgi:tetratricopeptide (TPR) repeat protein
VALRQEKNVIAARQAWSRGDWEAVRAAARRATTPWKTLDPLACPVAFLEGMAEVRLGRVPEGIACLERARTHNPNRMYIVNNLGIVYASTGRFDEAIECFHETALRYSHRIEPFNNLAGCLIETGRYVEAVELLDDILHRVVVDLGVPVVMILYGAVAKVGLAVGSVST